MRLAPIKCFLAENPTFVDLSGLSTQMVYNSLSTSAHLIIRNRQEILIELLFFLSNLEFL